MLHNFTVIQALVDAGNSEDRGAELNEQVHAIFVGLRVGLDDCGISEHRSNRALSGRIHDLEYELRELVTKPRIDTWL